MVSTYVSVLVSEVMHDTTQPFVQRGKSDKMEPSSSSPSPLPAQLRLLWLPSINAKLAPNAFSARTSSIQWCSKASRLVRSHATGKPSPYLGCLSPNYESCPRFSAAPNFSWKSVPLFLLCSFPSSLLYVCSCQDFAAQRRGFGRRRLAWVRSVDRWNFGYFPLLRLCAKLCRPNLLGNGGLPLVSRSLDVHAYTHNLADTTPVKREIQR